MSKRTIPKKVKVASVKVVLVKTALPKKTSTIKIIWSRPKPGLRGSPEIELVLAKPIEASTKFCFSDIPSSSQSRHDKSNHAIQTISERASRMITFDNLDDDSSLDVHETSRSGRTAEVLSSPPPFMLG
jgi:hypothetical protein